METKKSKLDSYRYLGTKMSADIFDEYSSLLYEGHRCSTFINAYRESEMFTQYLNSEASSKVRKIKNEIEKNGDLDNFIVFTFYAEFFSVADQFGSKKHCIVIFTEQDIRIYYVNFFSVETFVIPFSDIKCIIIEDTKVLLTNKTSMVIDTKSGLRHGLGTHISLFPFIKLRLIIAAQHNHFLTNMSSPEINMLMPKHGEFHFSDLIPFFK